MYSQLIHHRHPSDQQAIDPPVHTHSTSCQKAVSIPSRPELSSHGFRNYPQNGFAITKNPHSHRTGLTGQCNGIKIWPRQRAASDLPDVLPHMYVPVRVLSEFLRSRRNVKTPISNRNAYGPDTSCRPRPHPTYRPHHATPACHTHSADPVMPHPTYRPRHATPTVPHLMYQPQHINPIMPHPHATLTVPHLTYQSCHATPARHT